MFSGIIEERATVSSINRGRDGATVTVSVGMPTSEISLGESIAIDGVCLTVVRIEGQNLGFDLAEETLRRSTFSNIEAGALVNVERSLRVGDRISGHFVFGHVDGQGELLEIKPEVGSVRYSFRYPAELGRYLVEKGSISLNGVSLTLGAVSENSLAVYVIPHTAEVTNLGKMHIGARVNIEIDMLARYVEVTSLKR